MRLTCGLSSPILVPVVVWLSLCADLVAGHGFLIEPHSRNLVRYNLQLESCPHCLQSGGPATVASRGGNTWPSIDAPGSHGLCGDPGQGQPVPPNISAETYMQPTPVQETYVPGSMVEFRIGLTAHHRGHYEFRICDQGLDGNKLASHAEGQECLNTWVLERVPPEPSCVPNDVADCQPLDPRHPERWYIPPPGRGMTVAGTDWKDSDAKPFPSVGDVHHARFKIPLNLTCEHCTLQWYYATGNTCLFDCDYFNYFRNVFAPAGWDASAWVMFAMEDWATCDNSVCGPKHNGGFGEEFWNCADVAVLPAGPTPPPTPWPTVLPTSPSPTSSPAPTDTVCVDGTLPADWGRPCAEYQTSDCAENPMAFCTSPDFLQQCCFCGGGTVETPMPTASPSSGAPLPQPTSSPSTMPTPEAGPTQAPTPGGPTGEKKVMLFVENWLTCPSLEEVKQYTHVIISFAVTYTWRASKNLCSSTCQVGGPVPICENQNRQDLVDQWRSLGVKVLLSFGGAGMGGSWAGDVNDCWEQCFDRVTSLTNQLGAIVEEQRFDGIDIDYEYHLTAPAPTFLADLTKQLRAALPAGKTISHAPMDSDLFVGQPYYDVIQDIASEIDYLLPQYYNGPLRPVRDMDPVLEHFGNLVSGIFDGEAEKVVFGFCAQDCSGTGSNADGTQAVSVLKAVDKEFPTFGGAFLWAAAADRQLQWSTPVKDYLDTWSHQPTVSPTSIPFGTPTPAPTPALTVLPCAALWGQCGGMEWKGPTCCVAGSDCKNSNPWYSQCLPTAVGKAVPTRVHDFLAR